MMKSKIARSFTNKRGIIAVFLLLNPLIPSLMAFNQPPTNLATTTFLDFPPAPGFYYFNYSLFIDGSMAVGNDGKEIPGNAQVSVLAQLNQFSYISPLRVFGANVAAAFVLPIVAPTSSGSFGSNPVTANTAGTGDVVFGPFLQWNGKLLGGPFMQRFELDFTLPTGKYDKNKMVNPGSNLCSLEPYYSTVWMFLPRWETSWRFFYLINGENDESHVKPGRLFHLNYAVSYGFSQKVRAGVAGYMLHQLTDDEYNGNSLPGSKERALAIGPGIVYLGQGMTAMLSHPVEFGVRNRFKGNRTTLQLIHKF